MKQKLLSLSLALALLLSLPVLAKDFSDAGQIAHTEAVGILSELGVVKGRGGAFDPAAYVTRAEMAKMIAVICTGSETVEAPSSQLTDIGSHWAKDYIAYCESRGIVSGRGGGIFAPNDDVTSAEAAKMLLTALGYQGAYTGADWAIHVVMDAQLANLYGDVSTTSNEPLNRENAAQMIYNALLTETVTENGEAGLPLLGTVFGLQAWEGECTAGLPVDTSAFADGQLIRIVFRDGENGLAGQLDAGDTVYSVFPVGA